MERFENKDMPYWLENALMFAFRKQDMDEIKAYQKLWEDMQNGE